MSVQSISQWKGIPQSSSLQQGLGPILDGASITRNSAASTLIVPAVASSAAGPAIGLSVTATGVGFGAAATVQGLLIADTARKVFAQACKHKDNEGACQAGLMGTVGVSFSTLGVGLGISSGATLAGKVGLAAAGGLALTIAGFILYGALSIYAGYGLYSMKDFSNGFEKAQKNPQEVAKLLKGATTLSAEEKTKSESEKNNILQGKFDRLSRYIGQETLKKIIEERNLNEIDFEKILEKEPALIDDIEKGIFREKLKYKIMILISIIGILSFIVAVAVPFIAPIIAAVASLSWLVIDKEKLFDWAAEKWWNYSHETAFKDLSYEELVGEEENPPLSPGLNQ